MPEPRPFITFSFEVRLTLPDENSPLCRAAFAECDGLEMSVSPKTIHEGGNNGRVIHLPGPVSYGLLSLKRGMTADLGLWNWFERSQRERGLRARGMVLMLDSTEKQKREQRLRFDLTGCLPVKLRAPGLNAKDGQIAVEEMQIAYETLVLLTPNTSGA
jgi:phage tail-like protein